MHHMWVTAPGLGINDLDSTRAGLRLRSGRTPWNTRQPIRIDGARNARLMCVLPNDSVDSW